MALDINALRAAFKSKSEEGGGEGNTGFWDKFYPFYKMDFDQTTVFRFLPDADDENPLGFIVENKYHELNINGKKKRIACLKMYGESCPCCELSQPTNLRRLQFRCLKSIKHLELQSTIMLKTYYTL
jgi:hypothetical protein